MLEGKEVEKKLGEYGSVSLDVTPDLKVLASIEVHIDLIKEIEKLAAKTATPLDDQAMAWIKLLVSKPTA